MGEFWQGVAKCLSCFNIFLFLFGFIWVVWDSVHALFMTKTLLEDGIAAPIPYGFIFKTPIDGKQFLVNHVFDPKADGGGFDFNPFTWIEKMIPTLPIPSISYKGLYSDLVVPFMTPTVVAAINASKSTDPIIKMPELPDAPTMPGLAQFGLPTALPSIGALPGLTPPSVGVGTPISQVAPPAAPPAPLPAPPVPLPAPLSAPQAGGSRRNDFAGGPGPAIAGVLTAVVLAGGLKGFYDVISKQYG
jgi:hypothetical protein